MESQKKELSNSPSGVKSKYHIIGAVSTSKNQPLMRPKVGIQSQSVNALSRNPSKQWMLRDSSRADMQLKNAFIHQAATKETF